MVPQLLPTATQRGHVPPLALVLPLVLDLLPSLRKLPRMHLHPTEIRHCRRRLAILLPSQWPASGQDLKCLFSAAAFRICAL